MPAMSVLLRAPPRVEGTLRKAVVCVVVSSLRRLPRTSPPFLIQVLKENIQLILSTRIPFSLHALNEKKKKKVSRTAPHLTPLSSHISR